MQVICHADLARIQIAVYYDSIPLVVFKRGRTYLRSLSLFRSYIRNCICYVYVAVYVVHMEERAVRTHRRRLTGRAVIWVLCII